MKQKQHGRLANKRGDMKSPPYTKRKEFKNVGKNDLIILLKRECGIDEKKLFDLGILRKTRALSTQITPDEDEWLENYCFKNKITKTVIMIEGIEQILRNEFFADKLLQEFQKEENQKKRKKTNLRYAVNFNCDIDKANDFIQLCKNKHCTRSRLLRAYLLFKRKEVQGE